MKTRVPIAISNFQLVFGRSELRDLAFQPARASIRGKMSEYRSNYHPSSQSRKMSIGVMVVDSQPKTNHPAPDDVAARAEELKSTTVADLQPNKKVKGDSAANQRSSAKGTELATSPWRSPRSSSRKLGTLENVLSKQTSGSKGLNKGPNEAPVRDSFHDIPVSSPRISDGELMISGRNGKEVDKSPERMEEPPSAVLPQKVASQREDKDGTGKAKDGSTDVLRSKLWEILGKASPENNEDVNSETPQVVKTSSRLNQDKSSNDDPLTKPRHHSDTIETDSESPEAATRRPVTRSLLQRRVGAKGIQKRTKTGANLGGGISTKDVNNVFTFEEGLRGENGTAMNSTLMPKTQRGRKKNTVAKCRKVQSREKDGADGILKETSKSKTPARSESTRTGKRSSLSDKKGSSLEFNQHTKARKQKPDVSAREEDFQPSPEDETAATPEMFRGLFKNGDEQEKSVEPENDFQSPTFGYKAPISSPSPCLSPEASPLHPRNISPAFDETEATIFSFGTKKTPQGTKGQASNKRLPEFLEKKRDYSFGRESSAEPDEDLVLSDPSSDEKDSDGSTEDSPALGNYNSPQVRETDNWRSDKSKPGIGSVKRNSNFKGNGRVVSSPTSSLAKGMHKTDSYQQFLEVDEDEGLGRAVALFAVALQNFDKKLKSAAKKKSSEIIASVSEEIHLELENVKSHIITEAEKTSNVAKTKRKHAETRLQEQQEKMRMIQEKFKDDVGNHLEDFKSTIEELEANHSDLKGSIKKQRTLHQKLIAHFEGGIETKLENATKRINSVNESARGKMMQLKMIVAECLKDD
ncbi:Meiosis-specific protein ASY3 [Hirschfeldia incana]|nr:Meiosis-specific protein ASY3 [Hirschfeldia incana]